MAPADGGLPKLVASGDQVTEPAGTPHVAEPSEVAGVRCPSCLEHKPRAAFARNCANRSGLQTYCKPCHAAHAAASRQRHPLTDAQRERRRSRLQAYQRQPHGAHARKVTSRYGLTTHEYEAILAKQHGRCAICKAVASTRLHIDHDHDSGRVRGLLCGPCNRGIGLLRDSPELLKAAHDYLTEVQPNG